MNFLQPWLLLALPLIALPIVIHLVNQWRYQTKAWAAMMFLLQARSMHRGMAKLRQWLILAIRTLAVAALILAISRPLALGVLGRLAVGSVETTIVMLDRSPSMSEYADRVGETKLKIALRQVKESLQHRRSTHWLLIDSVFPDQVQEFGSLDELIRSTIEQSSDASADWSRMMRTAYNHLQDHASSDADLWICSDMRAGDWHAVDGPWSDLRNDFKKLTTRIRFLTLAYSSPTSNNLGIRVTEAAVAHSDTLRELVLSLRVSSTQSSAAGLVVPVDIQVDRGRFQVDVSMNQGIGELKDYRITLDAGSEPVGWGRVSIPADQGPADNAHFFVYAPAVPAKTTIVYEDKKAVEAIGIAAQVATDSESDTSVNFLSADRAGELDWSNESLIVWQAPLPSRDIALRLEDFIADGGTLWLLPPRELLDQSIPTPPDKAIFGFRWTAVRNLSQAVQPATWRSDEGLLASTQSGISLPVGELGIGRYAESEGEAMPLASLADGGLLLSRLPVDGGAVFVCSTWPVEPYSTFSKNGIVLFVAVQRSLRMSSDRNLAVKFIDAGIAESELVHDRLPSPKSWQKRASDETFLSQEIGLHRGVFEAGGKLVAVNRSEQEDDPATLDDPSFKELLAGLDVTRIEEVAGTQRRLQQEIWRLFLTLMIAALLIEAALSLPRRARLAT